MPLLSIEFAVFFIVFLPLYWAFARFAASSKTFYFWLPDWAGFTVSTPFFAALILVLLAVVYLISCADVF